MAAAYDKLSLSDGTLPLYTHAIMSGRIEYFDDFCRHFGVPQGLYRDLLAVFLRDPRRLDHAAAFQVQCFFNNFLGLF